MVKSKSYPIGAKVIYNPLYPVYCGDEKYRNKVGTVVVISDIFPQCRFPDGKVIAIVWKSLEILPQKNEQLLFDFAY